MHTTLAEKLQTLAAKQQKKAADAARLSHAETLTFLRRAHDASVELAKPLALDKLNAQLRAALLLYGNIVELVGAFTLLCEQRLWVGAPAVARSALEAYVDFLNVCEDADYVQHLEAHFGVEHLKTLRAARDKNNPFFAGVRQVGNLNEVIRSTEQRVDELRKKGFGRLKIKERFVRANAENVYLSVYNSLSDEAHNSIAALYRRQLEGQNGIKFSVYRAEPRNDVLPLVDTMAGIITGTTIQIHGLLGTEGLEAAKSLELQFAEIRKGYKV